MSMGENNKHKKARTVLFYIALITMSLIRAISNYMFIVPNAFAPGGVSGIASILYNAVLPTGNNALIFWLDPGITIFILNIPLILWAFKSLNKKFAFNTMLAVLVFSCFMLLFSLTNFPVFKAETYESSIMLLASLAGGALSGVGLGFMLRMNISLGGTDIVGKAIYKKNPIVDVQWLIFLVDCIVVLASGLLGLRAMAAVSGAKGILVVVLSPIFYSFITLFLCSKVADLILTGLESSLIFNIITNQPENLAAEIIKRVKRGVTIIKGVGVYTNSDRNILICVVRKKQINTMKKIINELAPEAFVYIANAREVNGKGFRVL